MTNLRKILIADDDVDFRTVLHDQLRMTEDY
ncbi:MAG: DNA-binding response regulator, partial [Alphaproteobacteria bacterium HGW-Alphaproteobacteria-2]